MNEYLEKCEDRHIRTALFKGVGILRILTKPNSLICTAFPKPTPLFGYLFGCTDRLKYTYVSSVGFSVITYHTMLSDTVATHGILADTTELVHFYEIVPQGKRL